MFLRMDLFSVVPQRRLKNEKVKSHTHARTTDIRVTSSPRFRKFKSNTTFDWLSQSKIVLLSTAFEYKEKNC